MNVSARYLTRVCTLDDIEWMVELARKYYPGQFDETQGKAGQTMDVMSMTDLINQGMRREFRTRRGR